MDRDKSATPIRGAVESSRWNPIRWRTILNGTAVDESDGDDDAHESAAPPPARPDTEATAETDARPDAQSDAESDAVTEGAAPDSDEAESDEPVPGDSEPDDAKPEPESAAAAPTDKDDVTADVEIPADPAESDDSAEPDESEESDDSAEPDESKESDEPTQPDQSDETPDPAAETVEAEKADVADVADVCGTEAEAAPAGNKDASAETAAAEQPTQLPDVEAVPVPANTTPPNPGSTPAAALPARSGSPSAADLRTPAHRAVLAGAAVLTVIAIALTVWAGNTSRSAAGSGDPTRSRSASPSVAPPILLAKDDSTFTIPGSAPDLGWPKQKGEQIAVEIEGIGSLGVSGDVAAPVPIASVAKTMTAHLILTDHPLGPDSSGPTITVTSAEADAYPQEERQGQSLVAVRAGERLTERQALDALMLASADNVAKILARWDAGSVRAFVPKMNAAAAALGMSHTTYTDPSGLAASTVSTATDQLKLGAAAMRDPTFRAIVAQSSAEVPVQGGIHNWNTLLGQDGIAGIKTGSTMSAGGCLLFAANTTVAGHHETVIGVVLGVPGSSGTILENALAISRKLVAATEAAVKSVTVLAPGTEIAALRSAGRPDVPLTVAAPVTVIGWPGLKYLVTVNGTARAATVSVTRDGASAPAADVPLRPRTAPKSGSARPSPIPSK
jgi:serine-type D-Ala-D-Ala carboxypeptidase (penicillin-binding protein 5/6)